MTTNTDITNPETISTIKSGVEKIDLFASSMLQKPLQAGWIKLGVTEKIGGAL